MAFWQGVFLLVGTTIGAGVFSLPYSFSQSGWGISLFGLVILGLMMTALNLFYSKVILDNQGDHQLVGYVREYLGPFWQKVALFVLLFSVNGVMIAYVILGGEFLALLLGQSTTLFYSFWFYLIIAFLFMRGFKFLAKAESVFSITLILLFLFFPVLVIKYATPSQMRFIGHRPLFFWGPTLLALSGFSAIPEVEEILRKKGERKKLGKAVVVGTWLPILVYSLFAFGVYSVTGVFTTADALTGLVQVIPHIVQVAAGIGLLALLTSFLSLANVAKETYYRDLDIDENLSKVLALLPPIIGIFLSLPQLANIISFVGAVGLAITSSLICLLFTKIDNKKWLAFLVGLLFISGAVAKIVKLV